MVRALTLLLLLSACNRVVEQRAFDTDGRLEWSVVMPGSRNTALWLSYVVSGPAQRVSLEDEAYLAYEFAGALSLTANGGNVYSGSIFLKPEGPAVDRVYTEAKRKDVERSCGYSSCTERGRIKLVQLHEVEAGALLALKAHLPTESAGNTLDSAVFVLGPN